MAGECFMKVTSEFADRPEVSQGQGVPLEELHKGASGWLEAILPVSWGSEL